MKPGITVHIAIVFGSALVFTALTQLPAYLNANDPWDGNEHENAVQAFSLTLLACTGAYAAILKAFNNGKK